MDKPMKERKPMTPEQLEVLKARLMKARDAKLARVKGAVKDEVIKQIPITKVVDEIVKELPFEKPLPKKRVPKPKTQPQPEVIPFEEPLPKPKPHGMGWKMPKSEPIDIPQKKDKNRFCKIVYYSEPSKKTLKKLNKIQDSSSSESESSDEEPERQQPITIRQPVNNEDEYYKQLAKKFYG
jgi:hypothetical protein